MGGRLESHCPMFKQLRNDLSLKRDGKCIRSQTQRVSVKNDRDDRRLEDQSVSKVML